MPLTGRGLFFLVKEFKSKNKYKETQTQELQTKSKRTKKCVEQKRMLL